MITAWAGTSILEIGEVDCQRLIRDTSDSPGSGINESTAGAPPSSRASDEAAAAGGALLEVNDPGTNRDAGASQSTVTPSNPTPNP